MLAVLRSVSAIVFLWLTVWKCQSSWGSNLAVNVADAEAFGNLWLRWRGIWFSHLWLQKSNSLPLHWKNLLVWKLSQFWIYLLNVFLWDVRLILARRKWGKNSKYFIFRKSFFKPFDENTKNSVFAFASRVQCVVFVCAWWGVHGKSLPCLVNNK